MKLHINQITTLITLLFVSAFCIHVNAQAVTYSYDNNGNRIDPRLASASAPKKHNACDSSKVKVYPNPTSGQVSVSLPTMPSCGSAVIYLSDISGNVLSTENVTASLTPISLANYNQGQYNVSIVMCNDKYSCPVIKETPSPGNPAQKPTFENKVMTK